MTLVRLNKNLHCSYVGVDLLQHRQVTCALAATIAGREVELYFRELKWTVNAGA